MSVKKNHNKLSSLAVKSLVCKEADKFVVLPIFWYKQEIVEVGYFHSLPEQSIQGPYTIPQRRITLSNSTLAAELYSRYETIGLKNMIYWCQFMINSYLTLVNKYDWQFSIHASDSKLVNNSIIFSNSPRKAGWGRTKSEDIPCALAFINKWSTQSEVSQIIQMIFHNFS